MKKQSADKKFAFVLDIGTTGIKAFVFDSDLSVLGRVYKPLRKSFPHKGYVEQNPQELLSVSKEALQEVRQICNVPERAFTGFGLTNQRETTILWDKTTGKPAYPAIVWEDERTARECRKWRKEFGETARKKTGLPITPYFSASKIWWLLKNNRRVEELLEQKNLLFGTVDTWILWNLIEGNPHLTDYTNASRTLLFNIRTLEWDDELLNIFGIPRAILPEVRPSQENFGNLKKDILGFPLPVRAVAGDQQASIYAAGTGRGTTKATFGTGTFVVQNIGSRFSLADGFFTTLTADKHQPNYSLEAKVEFYGRTIQDALSDGKPLAKLLKKLAKLVDERLRHLPVKPKSLVIDGGVTRAKELAPILNETSGIPIRTQKIFDGTALGIAKMLLGG